ncbi:hypothetical protein PG984_007514 [Apiospora sp. TS-2023a]
MLHWETPPTLPLRTPSVDLDGADEDSSSSSSGDLGTPLADLDHDTGRPLQQPSQQCKSGSLHRVRVQGQLAFVSRISVVSPQGALPNQEIYGEHAPLPAARSDKELGGGGSSRSNQSGPGNQSRTKKTMHWSSSVAVRRNGRSLTGVAEDDEEDVMVWEQDTQLRGYGIGGAGNIRRSTDVIGTSTRSALKNTLFASSSAHKSDWRRWNVGDYIDQLNDRKGRPRAAGWI